MKAVYRTFVSRAESERCQPGTNLHHVPTLAWTTERSDLRITTSHAPTPSCQSNACPNDEVPASAPAMLPGASFHGGITK
jgi:hypothetical protein